MKPPDTITRTYTGIVGHDHSHTLEDIKVIVVIIHAETVHNHITDSTTEAPHDIITPTLITTAVTCQTEDHHHAEAYQPTPEIIVDSDHTHQATKVRTPHLHPHPVPAGQQ